MEAVSARMAARDRFGSMGEPGPSPLLRFIQSACDPVNFEPNLALDLEIADLINSKKGNAPREAAVAIVNYINHRNQNVALLALALLDICVKNCGYAFHLQISTKDFLNELVRRFPERPPVRPSRVQLKILEAIEEWRGTICQTSRYKEDLGYIRDMHRLLSYKGYRFPEVRKEDAAVLNPSDNLKSADEMEEEERAAQAAKLQELIRRGGPEDLQEANRLMKVMAGYDTKHQTDWRAKAAEEVGKIQQKAKLLEEMLEGFRAGDHIAEESVFQELANALQNAQPKIQKMCEEESDDSEAVAKLLEINDSIHRTLQRYKLTKKGDLDGASKIERGTLGTTTGVAKSADNELSLIDLEDSPTVAQPSLSSAKRGHEANYLESDLSELSFQESPFGQGGGITLGLSPSQASSQNQHQNTSRLPPPFLNKSDFSAYSSLTGSRPISQSTTPIPSIYQQQQQQQQQRQSQQPSDPFASLLESSNPPSKSVGLPPPLLDIGPTPQPQASPTDPDEWVFSSSLPEPSLPSTNTILVTNSSLKIELQASRAPAPASPISINISVSNNTSHPISIFTLQFAVTKGFSLKLSPQSGRTLKPNEAAGITQHIDLLGVEPGSGASVKMRWKASYQLGSESRGEQGEIATLGIA
ncbi:MAG: hypothetical protein M1829_001377 [Trizodia sp. TS-e1964]|nr:MAG: hypothetical protein M1829_001377 [Trizodia sp. TS-e1964]